MYGRISVFGWTGNLCTGTAGKLQLPVFSHCGRKGDEERADTHFWRRQLEAAFARTKETDGVRMDGQPLVLSQVDVRVILPRTEIEKLSDEVHEIEIWLGKGEERQR